MYGVLDIGSNTIRLVTYIVEDNQIIEMMSKRFHLGLAGHKLKDGKLKGKALKKLIQALKELKLFADYIKLKDIYAFATQVIRASSNSEEIIQIIYNETGFDVKILSGKEEALFDYYGISIDKTIKDGILVDVGGGSTEILLAENNKVIYSKSLALGSLSLYKNYIKAISPKNKEIINIEEKIETELAVLSSIKSKNTSKCIYAVGGTARAAKSFIAQNLELSDFELNSYKTENLNKLIKFYKKNPNKFNRSLLKLKPERIHTFIPGILVYLVVARYFLANKIITSNKGVREGYLWYHLNKKGLINDK